MYFTCRWGRGSALHISGHDVYSLSVEIEFHIKHPNTRIALWIPIYSFGRNIVYVQGKCILDELYGLTALLRVLH
jgi:hypothetical protein